MPLPQPRPGSPPAATKLTAVAHSAIIDDGTIHREIRVAVLFDLESATDPRSAFTSICRDEDLSGPHLAVSSTLQVGRAMPLDDFERGLTGGWFGADRMDAAVARTIVADLKVAALATGGSSGAVAMIRAMLDPGTSIPILDRRVTWYFYDERAPEDPLKHVASDLAHRLALPCVWGRKVDATSPIEFIVFAIPAASIDAPRKPRFTDCGELKYLEIWRPGGATAPWISNCAGLDEAVATPTILGRSIAELRIIQCYES